MSIDFHIPMQDNLSIEGGDIRRLTANPEGNTWRVTLRSSNDEQVVFTGLTSMQAEVLTRLADPDCRSTARWDYRWAREND